jgi:SAM-dependent methyltransferase
LDVGGASGAHAQWLVAAGYEVHIVDLTPRHVEKALADLGPLGVTAEVGDARELTASTQSYDSVLLLGPMYHLTNRSERIRCLHEALRVVRSDGVVAVAAISRFASLCDGLARGFFFDPRFRKIVERDLAEGQHRNPENVPHWFTTAYFHEPQQLHAEIEEAGMRVRELVGVEGPAGCMKHLVERWDTPEGREAILYAARAVESEPSIIGMSGHLLAIGEPILHT